MLSIKSDIYSFGNFVLVNTPQIRYEVGIIIGLKNDLFIIVDLFNNKRYLVRRDEVKRLSEEDVRNNYFHALTALGLADTYSGGDIIKLLRILELDEEDEFMEIVSTVSLLISKHIDKLKDYILKTRS